MVVSLNASFADNTAVVRLFPVRVVGGFSGDGSITPIMFSSRIFTDFLFFLPLFCAPILPSLGFVGLVGLCTSCSSVTGFSITDRVRVAASTTGGGNWVLSISPPVYYRL